MGTIRVARKSGLMQAVCVGKEGPYPPPGAAGVGLIRKAHMKTHGIWKAAVLAAVFAVGLLPPAARADWMVGDPYKMHYPQLPDPNGWDVKVDGPNVVADDFLCTASGPITDIHFWGSWRGDIMGNLSNIHLSLHADIPADPQNPDSYSMPGVLLWEYNTMDYDPGLVTSRPDGSGSQGWYDPLEQLWIRPDHNAFFQYNVSIDSSKWFTQTQGTIYWLDLHAVNEIPGTEFGWKTSLQHWNDDAVTEDFYDIIPGKDWIELTDPLAPSESLDMAYVVVPEPHAGWFLLAGVAGLLARRRRNSISGRIG